MSGSLEKRGYVIVTDHLPADGKTDISEGLQKLIDENPHRTIYFPDGVYLLGKSVCTPAHPERSVSLKLSNYAVIKASDGWSEEGALIRLGGKDPANDIHTVGSNYSLVGGILDGNGKADGVSIDGGRETLIRDVSIKHTRVGLHIKYGANWGSSDCDIFGVNIVGTGKPDSIGVLLEGFDNTLTNMRIAHVQIGVLIKSAGNNLRNIHPLHEMHKYEDYKESYGFWDQRGGNWFNFCYADHFCTGFRTSAGVKGVYDSCFCMWYNNAEGNPHTAFHADGKLEAVLTNFRIGFFDGSTENIPLSVGEAGGNGVLQRLLIDRPEWITDDTYKAYLQGGIV